MLTFCVCGSVKSPFNAVFVDTPWFWNVRYTFSWQIIFAYFCAPSTFQDNEWPDVHSSGANTVNQQLSTSSSLWDTDELLPIPLTKFGICYSKVKAFLLHHVLLIACHWIRTLQTTYTKSGKTYRQPAADLTWEGRSFLLGFN